MSSQAYTTDIGHHFRHHCSWHCISCSQFKENPPAWVYFGISSQDLVGGYQVPPGPGSTSGAQSFESQALVHTLLHKLQMLYLQSGEYDTYCI